MDFREYVGNLHPIKQRISGRIKNFMGAMQIRVESIKCVSAHHVHYKSGSSVLFHPRVIKLDDDAIPPRCPWLPENKSSAPFRPIRSLLTSLQEICFTVTLFHSHSFLCTCVSPRRCHRLIPATLRQPHTPCV